MSPSEAKDHDDHLRDLFFRKNDVFFTTPCMHCPCGSKETPCEEVIHIDKVEFGSGVPKESTSGPGLVVHMFCEGGHRWEWSCTDHSGGMWLGLFMKEPASLFPELER